MEENKKVFIRSCIGRGSEVINTLKELGATKVIEVSGEAKDTIYFIDHDNHITCALVDSEIGRIIMDTYKEIEIPQQQQWKEGDILVYNSNPFLYAVFGKYRNEHTFETFFLFCQKEVFFNTVANIEDYHLTSEK